MKKIRFSKDGKGVLSPSYNSFLRFPNKLIIPLIRRIIPNKIAKELLELQPIDPEREKSFREAIDGMILEDLKEAAKKETEGEKVKKFLEEYSTRIGEEDEEKKTKG